MDNSKELDETCFVVYGLVLTFICVFGILGCVLSIIIFQRPSMKSSYSIILLNLAFWDSILLLSYLMSYAIPSMEGTCPSFTLRFKYNLSRFVYRFITNPLRKVGHTGSVYSTILVSVERYVAICLPLYARDICTRKRAVVGSILVAAFSIIFNLPRWFDTAIERPKNLADNYKYVSSENDTEEYDEDSLYFTKLYMKFYRGWATAVVMYIGPFCILPVLNFAICQNVRVINSRRKSMTFAQMDEINITKMLWCIVTVFWIANAPFGLFSICRILGFHEWPTTLEMFANSLVAMNSGINFMIYCLLGKKFRRELFSLFKPKFDMNSRTSSEHYRLMYMQSLTSTTSSTRRK